MPARPGGADFDGEKRCPVQVASMFWRTVLGKCLSFSIRRIGATGGKGMLFQDRTEAGQVLAAKLMSFANRPDVLVLALPRGGVPVAYEVARALRAPLDLCLVRTLAVPGHSELTRGALASGGVLVLNEDVVGGLGIADEEIAAVVAEGRRELERRQRLYRGERPAPDVRDRIVILVDDGLDTGSTMRAAIAALRQY